MAGIVIPSDMTRESLYPLLKVALAVAPVYLIDTGVGLDVPFVGALDEAFDAPFHLHWIRSEQRNIHTWWNLGLEHCGSHALVLNDDIVTTPAVLANMLDALGSAALVTLEVAPSRPADARCPISGWAFGLNPEKLRPDEQFTWWFGDDDLWLTAESQGLGIRGLPLRVEHRPPNNGEPAPEFREVVREDGRLFEAKWGAYLAKRPSLESLLV